ncbi:hypothetical protein IAR50_002563 [Cryptococcus sp. DSM 104548]
MPNTKRSQGGPVYIDSNSEEQDIAELPISEEEEERMSVSNYWRQVAVYSETEGEEIFTCFTRKPKDVGMDEVKETFAEPASDLSLVLLSEYHAKPELGRWVSIYYGDEEPQESTPFCPGDCLCAGRTCFNEVVPSELALSLVREIAELTGQRDACPKSLEDEDTQQVVKDLVTNWRDGNVP